MKEPDPRTFSGSKIGQRPEELEQFIAVLKGRGIESYLEIGARQGDTFHAVMSELPVGSIGVAVDMPEGPWGKRKSKKMLDRAIDDLTGKGYRAGAVIGDSRDEDVKREVARRFDQYLLKVDAILIDGDHSYAGVKADWENWKEHAALVAFHDIDGDGRGDHRFNLKVEVPKLWAEIVASGEYETQEIIAGEPGMGIGIVFLERR